MSDNWWSSARQDPAAIPFRNKFDAARDPLTARNAIGAVDAKYVTDAIAAAGGGGGGAPTTAQYITAATDATLTAERVLTNTATVTWDFSVAGQAKATAISTTDTEAVQDVVGGMWQDSLRINVTYDDTLNRISADIFGSSVDNSFLAFMADSTIKGRIAGSGSGNPVDLTPAQALTAIGAQPAGSYQPLDGDLTSLAAAAGTDALYYRRIANTWDPVTIGTGLTFTSGTLAASAAAATSEVPQCGRLEWVSATALQFKPYNGDGIRISGTRYAIPAAGIAGLGNTGVFVNGTGGQNLAASTTYWVYAFINSGTVTGDFRTTTHATSATAGNVGVEILSGNDTRTLIGLINTNASSQFQFSATDKRVISWFNRRNIGVVGLSTGGTTTAATSFVELGAPARLSLVTWAEEAIHFGIVGDANNNTAGQYVAGDVGIDSAVVSLPRFTIGTSYAASAWVVLSGETTQQLAEGYHYLTPLGTVSGGTGAFYLCAIALIRG